MPFIPATRVQRHCISRQKPGIQDLPVKRFAEIIQHHVVTTLNTNNRKIIERPNLVVLKATTMPAALAEIAL